MRFNRFLGDFNLNDKRIRISNREQISQIKNVLRLGVGDELTVLNGDGREALTVITALHKETAELEVRELRKADNEPKREVTLCCAILKRENFELVAQKATEIGVKKIVPIVTERTIKTGLNHDRLNKIIREAVEQSGRCVVPELTEILNFAKAVELAKTAGSANFFYDLIHQLDPFASLNAVTDGKTPVAVFIGPEGGWSDEERSLAQKNGLVKASLGNLVLRGETAAIVASYLACHI